MSKKNMVLVPFFSCALLLVMGALNHQTNFSTRTALGPFVAQTFSLDPGLEKLTPQQLLARSAALLAPNQSPWLCYNIWQKQTHEDVSFEAKGRLVRGPNQCARLEWTVRSCQQPSEVIIVSDGVGLANVCRLPGQPTQIATQKFTSALEKPLSAEEVHQILIAHGCGGPQVLLQDLGRAMEKWKVETGTWKNKPVLRLVGAVIPSKEPADPSTIPLRFCHLYLDAQTLWPCRLEWWVAKEEEGDGALFLELEFRDPEINQPLSHEECVRAFTYQPEE